MARLCLLLVALPLSVASAAEFAPEQPGPVPAHLRVDFRTGWNLTDGAGMIDHVGLELVAGPQIGTAKVGGPIAVSPLVGAAAGMAEDAQPSLRVFGGAELVIAVHERVELVPALFGGFLKQWKNDLREGPMARAAVSVRLLSDEDFFLNFTPLSLTMLPPPPGGFTRYTTHVSLDVGVVHFGGRTP